MAVVGRKAQTEDEKALLNAAMNLKYIEVVLLLQKGVYPNVHGEVIGKEEEGEKDSLMSSLISL